MAKKSGGELDGSDRFKNRPEKIGEKPLTFDSFEKLGEFLKNGNNWISKLYIQAHGTQSGIKMPDGAVLSSMEFTQKLFKEGVLKERLIGKTPPKDCFHLKIRSMACLTGARDVDEKLGSSFVEQLRSDLSLAIRTLTESKNPTSPTSPTSPTKELMIHTKGPRGWQFTWNDGKNVTYHTINKEYENELDKNIIPTAMAKHANWDHENPPMRDAIIPRKFAYTFASSHINEAFGRITQENSNGKQSEERFIKRRGSDPASPPRRRQSLNGAIGQTPATEEKKPAESYGTRKSSLPSVLFGDSPTQNNTSTDLVASSSKSKKGKPPLAPIVTSFTSTTKIQIKNSQKNRAPIENEGAIRPRSNSMPDLNKPISIKKK